MAENISKQGKRQGLISKIEKQLIQLILTEISTMTIAAYVLGYMLLLLLLLLLLSHVSNSV